MIERPPPSRIRFAARHERANGRDEVQIEDTGKRLRRRAHGGGAGAGAGIVDQAVEPSVPVHDVVDSRSRSVSSVTSQLTASALGISWVSAASRSARRAARTGIPPASPTARASWAPSPELAPVMMTTRPRVVHRLSHLNSVQLYRDDRRTQPNPASTPRPATRPPFRAPHRGPRRRPLIELGSLQSKEAWWPRTCEPTRVGEPGAPRAPAVNARRS